MKALPDLGFEKLSRILFVDEIKAANIGKGQVLTVIVVDITLYGGDCPMIRVFLFGEIVFVRLV